MAQAAQAHLKETVGGNERGKTNVLFVIRNNEMVTIAKIIVPPPIQEELPMGEHEPQQTKIKDREGNYVKA